MKTMFYLIVIVWLILINLQLDWFLIKCDNEQATIYQPTKQEIERFQIVQEQIRHHQKQDEQQQQQKELKQKLKHRQQQQLQHQQEDLMIQPRIHTSESLLIPQSALIPMFVHRQQQYNDHRVPMPPMLTSPLIPPPPSAHHLLMPSNTHHPSGFIHHQQLPTQFGPGGPVPPPGSEIININHHLNHHKQQNVPQMNYYRNGINNNPHHHQNPLDSSLNKHHQDHHQQGHHYNDRDDNLQENNNDKHQQDLESSSSRFDKNHGVNIGEEDVNRGAGAGGRYRFRCYSCHWDIAKCSDFNCYNNPDICTTNNFQTHMVQQADCIGGCEEFVITDPNGLTQQWKRGCAQPASLPITQRMRCQTFYEFGVRIDRCVCNQDWCNGSLSLLSSTSSLLLFWFLIFLSIIISQHV